MISPGSEASVRAAVKTMFDRIAQDGGAMAVGGAQVLALKDEAKRLLAETPGVQLPNDLLLYARTVTYLFGLGAQIDPDLDLVKISMPYLLRFLAQPEEPGAPATTASSG